MFGRIAKAMQQVSDTFLKKDNVEAENASAAENWFADPDMTPSGIAEANTSEMNQGGVGGMLSNLSKSLGNMAHEVENISDISIEHSDQNIEIEVGARAMTDDTGVDINEDFDPSANNAEALMLQQSEQTHMVQNISDIPRISIEEALAALESARGQDGVDPDLQEIINHPDAQAMLENLKENHINSFEIHSTDLDGLSPDEQIAEILESARRTTIEQGLDMPQSEQEASHEVSMTDYQYEHDYTNDDYGIA